MSAQLGLEDDVDPVTPPSGTGFRTVESKFERRRPGGPVLEREEALVRQVVPDDPHPATADTDADADAGAEAGSAKPETPSEPPAWRRTAMAELTALAADSDDLTPRRRR